MVKEHLKLVEENIQKACDKAGRDRSEVTLIAWTLTGWLRRSISRRKRRVSACLF